MKKVSYNFVFLLCMIGCLFGCSTLSINNNVNNSQVDDIEESKDIVLTLDNYEYYLTIRTQFRSSEVRGGWRASFYDVYISGAIFGLYKDCVLTLENGTIIKLDAAGCAQTTKTIINDKDDFVVVDVEGIITPYN
ncbi:MAG: hypothetical protein J5691_08055 [Bacilli bacterium]|nr:hypothetical protein [Bacilli bacterium]